MAEMVNEQGAAPAQGQAQGPEVMKEAAAKVMSQAQTLGQVAQAFGEAGAKGPAEKLGQASQLMMAAIEELGISQGQEQAAPQQAGQPVPA